MSIKTLSRLIPLLLVFSVSQVFAQSPLVEVFDVHYSDANELVNVVDGVLSKEGIATVSSSSNSIIVRDYPANIAEVKKLLARLDKKPVTMLITVQFIEEEKAKKFTAGLSFRTSGRGWRVATIPSPSTDGISVLLEAKTSNISGKKKQFIRILENREGTIFYGRQHPVVETSRHTYPGGGSVTSKNTTFKETGTSIKVTARIVENGKIMVSLTPETGRYNKGEKSFSVNRAETTVIVDDPGTIVIGGIDGGASSSGMGIPGGVKKREKTTHSVMILSVKSER